MSDKRKSIIKKRMSRTFNIGDYNSLVVDVSFEDEVEWETLEERNKKSENMTKLLLLDLSSSSKYAFARLGIGEHKCTVIDNINKTKSIIEETGDSIIPTNPQG
jgi:hypothetical protein